MVDRSLALAILELVAMSLPAFAILIQIVAESDFPYTDRAVPVTAASLGLFVVSGVVVLAGLFPGTSSVTGRVAIATLSLGMVGLLVGVGLIGLQTEQEQEIEDEQHRE